MWSKGRDVGEKEGFRLQDEAMDWDSSRSDFNSINQVIAVAGSKGGVEILGYCSYRIKLARESYRVGSDADITGQHTENVWY